jgi:LPPG:FO 2-phospho-L-lactate transferase
MSGAVVALCGGVGGAKLVHGLERVLPPGQLTAVINTGDDFRHLGLCISPDIDSVIYALSGLADPLRGWGRRDETWTFMAALRSLGGTDWFALGDGDLAMHVERTRRLSAGDSLTTVTAEFCRALDIDARLLPMSDDPVGTRLSTDEGWLDFQEYFVREKCRPAIREIAFYGATDARAQPDAIAALHDPGLRAVIICPSNPFVSVEPILAVPGFRDALRECRAPVVAVTPIIGGKAVKGPAAKMMQELGLAVTSEAVARRYSGLVDVFIADESDPPPASVDGIRMARARTLMRSTEDREQLARTVLAIADAVT